MIIYCLLTHHNFTRLSSNQLSIWTHSTYSLARSRSNCSSTSKRDAFFIRNIINSYILNLSTFRHLLNWFCWWVSRHWYKRHLRRLDVWNLQYIHGFLFEYFQHSIKRSKYTLQSQIETIN